MATSCECPSRLNKSCSAASLLSQYGRVSIHAACISINAPNCCWAPWRHVTKWHHHAQTAHIAGVPCGALLLRTPAMSKFFYDFFCRKRATRHRGMLAFKTEKHTNTRLLGCCFHPLWRRKGQAHSAVAGGTWPQRAKGQSRSSGIDSRRQGGAASFGKSLSDP